MTKWIPLSTGKLPELGEEVLICLPSHYPDMSATPAVAWLVLDRQQKHYWAFDDNRSYRKCELTKASHFAYIDMPHIKEK